MIFLLVSITFASQCDHSLRTSIYSETVIAKAIGRFEVPLEQRIFSAVLRAYSYDNIAKHFGVPIETVMDITRCGADFLWEEKHSESHE